MHNWQRTIDEMTDVAGSVAEDVEVKEGDQVMEGADVTDPAALSEIILQVVKVTRNVREAIYAICSLHNVDLLELVDEKELTNGSYLSDSFDLLLNDQVCNVRSDREENSSHCGVLTLDGMGEVVALCKWITRPCTHGHLFRSPLHFHKLYKMLSTAREKVKSDSDGGEGIATNVDKDRKKAIFEVEGVPMHYTREVENMMTGILSRKGHHICHFKQTVDS